MQISYMVVHKEKTMKKYHFNRLLKLADHLYTVKNKDFDISEWHSTTCGTVACACGHGCNIPSFRKAGFKLEKQWYSGDDYLFELVYDGHESFDAAAIFFGIECDEAEDLFSHRGYKNIKTKITSKIVANKIRKFVAKKQKEYAQSI